MNTPKLQRNTNLEILRIIAMLFIVAHHFAVNGFNDMTFVISNYNNYALYFLGILGKMGVVIFIFISAYFMIDSKFTFRKLLVLGGEVYFYTLSFLVIFLVFLTPAAPITLETWVLSLLPISHSAYWFITDYIVLMLLSPFLNKVLKGLSKGTYLKLLVLVIILWSVYPTFTGKSFGFDPLIWFIVLYMMGSFIRLHVDIDKISFKKLFIAMFASFAITYAASATVAYLAMLFDVPGLMSGTITVTTLYKDLALENKLFTLITSTAIFLIFLKRKEFSNRYINYAAGSVLGVYLIHENVFVRPYLWKTLFSVQSFYSSPYFILFAVATIILIFIASIGIDIIRRLTVEKVWIWIIDNKLNNVPNWINDKYHRFKGKIEYYLK